MSHSDMDRLHGVICREGWGTHPGERAPRFGHRYTELCFQQTKSEGGPLSMGRDVAETRHFSIADGSASRTTLFPANINTLRDYWRMHYRSLTPSMITLNTSGFPAFTSSNASSASSNLNRFVINLITSILPLAIRSIAAG